MSALNKDIFREIKNTRSRFLSIFVLVALAVAFLAGLRTTAPDMEATADTYLDGANMMDVRVISTLGLTDSDISALAAREGVRQAEGAYTIDGLVPVADNSVVVKVLSLSAGGINQPYLLSGRLPEAADECLVESSLLNALGGGLGDVITISTGDGAYEDALVRDSFTIVGTCNSPLYIALDRGTSTLGTGKVSSVIHLLPEAFDMDYYTDAYLTLDGALELNAYSDAYDQLADSWIDGAEDFGSQRAALRYREVLDEANEKLDDAQKEYDDAVIEVDEELADAKRELDDARAELDDGWAEWRKGWADLRREVADAQAEIDDGQRELDDALVELNDGEAEYADGVKELADGKAEYQDGLKEYQEGRDAYMEGRDEYEDGLAKYEDGLKEYRDGKAELDDAKVELDKAKKQLDDAAERLWAGEASYNAGKQQYDGGKAQFDAQVGQLTDGINAVTGGSLTSDQLMAGLAAGDPALTGTVDMALGGTGMTSADLVSTKGQLDSALQQLNSAASSLSWGWAEYDEGYTKYYQAKQEYDKGAKELADAWAELEDARSAQEAARKLQEAAKAELAAQEAEVDAVIRDISAQEDVLECMEAELKREANAMDSQIKKLEQQYAAQIANVPSESGFLWPLPASYNTLSSLYGSRTHPVTHKPNNHTGIDIPAPRGTNIYAAKSGVVTTSVKKGSYGNYVVISHSDGTSTLYAHMNKRAVSEGQTVKQGQVIGYVGTTGRSTGNHLHYEVRINGNRRDPVDYYKDKTLYASSGGQKAVLKH